MVFRRSLVRELTATAIGLFLVLLGILFTNLMLRLLARAAGGTVAPEGILALLGFNALFYFNILLSVALFLTVLLTLSRWYRDSEMIVWFTSGQGLTAWLKPILWFASPFLVAIVVLSLWLSPWAEQRRLEYERQLESREELSLLAPGLFKEFKQAKLVVFIESINSASTEHIRNIFLHSIDSEKDVTTVARIGPARGRGPTATALSCSRTVGATRESRERPTSAPRSSSTSGGASSPRRCARCPMSLQRRSDHRRADRCRGATERAELFWRISVPISAFLLVLLAVPLSYVNPRMGRSFNLITALLCTCSTSTASNIVQSFIAQGRISLLAGLLVIHTIAASVVDRPVSSAAVGIRLVLPPAYRHEDAQSLYRARGASTRRC